MHWPHRPHDEVTMGMTGSVAAIDLGATSGRVIVGKVGPDTLETNTVARFPNDPVRLADGLHWNLLGLYGSALGGLRAAFRDEPDITSIAIDSWAVDYGLLRRDDRGTSRLLGEPFHYRDERTVRGVAAVHERMPHAKLFERNGLQFLPFNTLYQLATEDPTVLALADAMLLIPDLVAYWLTGHAYAEVTNASTTGLLRSAERVWDDALIDTLGLPRELFPALVTPGTRIGGLQPHVAAAISGAATVTAVGSHDTASAVVAVPMRAESAAYISCGTWGLVGVEVSQPVITRDVVMANFTNEGGVDGRVRMLHNVMGLWVLSETVREWERQDGVAIDLPELLAAAAAVPATSVPVFDVNDTRFLPPGDMPARIIMWCVERDTVAPVDRPSFARSIVESLAQAFADATACAGRLSGIDVSTIHIVGGGALNELLCQRIADRAGKPVVAGPVEATALGNVLVQARAADLVTGTLESLRDLVARTHPPRRYEPSPTRGSW